MIVKLLRPNRWKVLFFLLFFFTFYLFWEKCSPRSVGIGGCGHVGACLNLAGTVIRYPCGSLSEFFSSPDDEASPFGIIRGNFALFSIKVVTFSVIIPYLFSCLTSELLIKLKLFSKKYVK